MSASNADTARVPYGGGDGSRPHHQQRGNSNRSARIACDFFIFLDILASMAFIIAGLAPVSWVGYTTTTDNTTTNSTYSIIYFTRYRTLFNICPNSVQTAVNNLGCSLLDLAPTAVVTSTDFQYWNIIAMRRTEIAFFIIAIILAGVAVLVHVFCCIPHCRHEAGNGYWKNGIASGVLAAFAAAFQLIGMIVFQADIYYEAVYSGINCVDCWGFWPSAITSVTQVTLGPAYALGWCAAGLLVYASIAYLSREFCVTRGCRPPKDYEEDTETLDGVSGINASGPYLKGAARNSQFNQVSSASRLQRYDVGAAPPQAFYPNLYARSDLQ